MIRPKQLASWCLADYVAKIEIEYPTKEKLSQNQEVIDGDESEGQDQNVFI